MPASAFSPRDGARLVDVSFSAAGTSRRLRCRSHGPEGQPALPARLPSDGLPSCIATSRSAPTAHAEWRTSTPARTKEPSLWRGGRSPGDQASRRHTECSAQSDQAQGRLPVRGSSAPLRQPSLMKPRPRAPKVRANLPFDDDPWHVHIPEDRHNRSHSRRPPRRWGGLCGSRATSTGAGASRRGSAGVRFVATHHRWHRGQRGDRYWDRDSTSHEHL